MKPDNLSERAWAHGLVVAVLVYGTEETLTHHEYADFDALRVSAAKAFDVASADLRGLASVSTYSCEVEGGWCNAHAWPMPCGENAKIKTLAAYTPIQKGTDET